MFQNVTRNTTSDSRFINGTRVTLFSEAPIKKDYYKALQNKFFIQKL